MAFTQRLRVRFDDVDYARIVYFPRLFGYCHQVFEDFFPAELKTPYAEMLQQRRVGYPAVHAEADFKAPLAFGDECRIVLEVPKLGDSSITCRYRLHKGDEAAVRSEITLVVATISMDTFKSVPIPADVRAAFERHRPGG